MTGTTETRNPVNTAAFPNTDRKSRLMNRLFLVGTGPGAVSLIPPRATEAIAASTDIVAYGLYFDFLGDLVAQKTCHALSLGEETERARLALNLAAQGKPTALLSSGDIGIFAMGAVVFELLDRQVQGRENHPEWMEIEIEVIPGISAMQANASAAGALLGHDFCAISLSDLLTPWRVIEKRIHSAGAGDFIVSFYNPVSKKRNWQLDNARQILLQYRPGNTPVILGRNLTRHDQSQEIVELGDLNADTVDMFTCVSVGNSESRHLLIGQKEWVYTPRGYSKKQ